MIYSTIKNLTHCLEMKKKIRYDYKRSKACIACRMEEAMNITVFWLIVLIALVAIEITTLGLTTIWFAGGALIAVVVAMLGGPVWLQITLFLLVSSVLLFFTRPIAIKYFNKDRVRTNAEGMIGKQAIVISEIDNANGIGQVTVNGQEWSARSSEEHRKFTPGDIVTVLAISGVKLIVEER